MAALLVSGAAAFEDLVTVFVPNGVFFAEEVAFKKEKPPNLVQRLVDTDGIYGLPKGSLFVIILNGQIEYTLPFPNQSSFAAVVKPDIVIVLRVDPLIGRGLTMFFYYGIKNSIGFPEKEIHSSQKQQLCQQEAEEPEPFGSSIVTEGFLSRQRIRPENVGKKEDRGQNTQRKPDPELLRWTRKVSSYNLLKLPNNGGHIIKAAFHIPHQLELGAGTIQILAGIGCGKVVVAF